MSTYPYQIASVRGGWQPWVKMTDAKKQLMLFMKETKADPVRKGAAPYRVFSDKEQKQPLFQIQCIFQDNVVEYETRAADGTRLGRLCPDDKIPGWRIFDEYDRPVGQVKIKNAWRLNLALAILIGWRNPLVYWFFPIQYTVEFRGQPVLLMKEHVHFFDVIYKLTQVGELQDPANDHLLMSSLLVPFWPL